MSWVKNYRAGANAPVAKMPDGKKTVEDWGKELGYLPEIFAGKKMELPGPHVPGQPVRAALGAVSRQAAPRYNHKFVAFRQAQLHHGWYIGQELTREEFEAAIRAPHEGPNKVVCR